MTAERIRGQDAGQRGERPAATPEQAPAEPRRRHLARRAFTGMVIVSAALALDAGQEYVNDALEVQQALAHTHPYIIEDSAVPYAPAAPLPMPRGAYEALPPDEKLAVNQARRPERLAVVNMPGFGQVDTYRAADVLRPFGRIGANWSVHYDNTGISTDVIARTIVAQAREDNIDEIGLYADSMGTIVESQVAVALEKLAPDIRIPFIVMDSPAVGLQVLRPKSRSDGYALLEGMHLPGAAYSRYARLAAELYLRQVEIAANPAGFPALYDRVRRQVFDTHDLPANTLLAEQFQMIVSADVEGDLRALGRLPADKRPAIVFMGAAQAGRDDVVDTPQSLRLVRKWTDKAGLPLIGPFGIRNFHHGAQWRSVREYQEVLGRKIVPRIIEASGARPDQPA